MRLGNNQKKVLKTIGILSLLAAAVVAPNILLLLKPRTASKKYRYKKSIDQLVDDDLIYLSGEKIKLTKKGKKLLKTIQTEDIQIKQYKHWNGIWNLVCYDIPEKYKKARDYFRFKLSDAGFYQVQKSLWVFPYECKEEIAVISQNLGIAPFVAYLQTDHLPQQNKLIKYFNLKIN